MKSIWAIAKLTVKAAFRYRLVLLMLFLLILAVVMLPALIKHDGTARGFIQIVLTYSLGSIASLLGIATLWLACGTLAREVEECQMQMVAVKPVARWQIWVGKLLGILILDAILLTVSGGIVFGLLDYRAKRLPQEQQDVLKNEVLVARGSAREVHQDLTPVVERIYQEQLKQREVSSADRPQLRKQIEEQVKSEFQLVAPGYLRRWEIPLGAAAASLKDQPLFIRTKFVATGHNSTFEDLRTFSTLWQVGPPETAKVYRMQHSCVPQTFYEFQIPPNLFDDKGVLTIEFYNSNEESFLFELSDGMEVLYRTGGFGMNYVRGLLIIFFWMVLLAAVGLAAGSFLSFPVASFLAMCLLVIVFSGGTMSQIVEQGGVTKVNHDTGTIDAPGVLDRLAVTFFGNTLQLIKVVENFSPIEMLSTGRNISWEVLLRAFSQIVVLMSGLFVLGGIVMFARRELAAVQGGQ